MLPFYEDKDDRDMIYVTHYLKTLSQQYDVRPMIRNTFWINKLKDPMICEAIEGVIEYAIEEVEDHSLDDMYQTQKAEELQVVRRSRSAPRSTGRL